VTTYITCAEEMRNTHSILVRKLVKYSLGKPSSGSY